MVNTMLLAVLISSLIAVVHSQVPSQCIRNDVCDFMLVLDGSGSIDDPDWIQQMQFANQLMDQLQVQYPNFRGGVVTFSDSATLEQGLTSNDATLDATFTRLQSNQPGGVTRTDLGITTALNELVTPSGGQPTRECFFMFILTDGVSTRTADTIAAADRAKSVAGKTERRIVAIGIGNNVDQSELEAIASSPTSTHVQIVNTFADLTSLLGRLCVITSGTACGDGILTANTNEVCDDGNGFNGDGCSFQCLVEAGCTCTNPNGANQPSVCTCVSANCGDANIETGEGCDDGNTANGDGCNSVCSVETGFTCSTNFAGRSVCIQSTCVNTDQCDIAIVLDKSGSIDDAEWALVRTFASSLVNRLSIIFPNGRQAIITYDTLAELNQGVTSNLTLLNNVVSALANGGGNTQTDDAIQLANTHLTQNARGSCRFMYILTDGVSTQRQNTLDAATAAKAAGITILAAGVGDQVDPTEIQAIASSASLASTAATFQDLQTLVDNLCRLLDVNACGDAVRRGNEACDDGNAVAGDGCTGCVVDNCFTCVEASAAAPSVCTRLTTAGCATCGNGVRQIGSEGCDDGNTISGDGCTSLCQVEVGWTCAIQTGNRPDFCSPICGDSRLRGVEACDDGNTTPGDGCSAVCTVEATWGCIQPGGNNDVASVCTQGAVCGDGSTTAPETCDDRNSVNGDGCNNACGVEAGWTCNIALVPSVCSPICSDGLLRGVEACDDGNSAPGDGCSATCTIEPGCTCNNANNNVRSVCTCSCITNFVCGNGNRDFTEECDDGNNVANDGCTNCRQDVGYACTVSVPNVCAPICGDGRVTGTEQCDDGLLVAGDGCSVTCTTEPGWLCSTTQCTPQFTCGDGTRTTGEECDDGNILPFDGCSATCTNELGFVCSVLGGATPGITVSTCSLQCTPNPCLNGASCLVDSLTSTFVCQCTGGWNGRLCDNCPTGTCGCGDGTRSGNEQCDDGNTRDGDGCSSTCTNENAFTCTALGVITVCAANDVCGDGIRSGTEACDDGNIVPGDGCTPTCTIETTHTCTTLVSETSVCTPRCGDGIRFPTEACDDGNQISGDGCSSTCEGEANFLCTPCNTQRSACAACVGAACAVCGDGITVPGVEDCDDGNTVIGDGSGATCVREPGWTCTVNPFGRCACTRCGDGIRQFGEACDDGDLVNGDGCDLNCNVEVGWRCIGSIGEVSRCGAVCGDGRIIDNEVCDDGNVTPGDGCGGFCTVENGFVCLRQTALPQSTCVPRGSICGDSRVDAVEACDDGDADAGDGCSPTCNVEPGWSCTRILGQRSTCNPINVTNCGDGVQAPTEACDDGNTADGDGCDSQCRIEVCGNNRIDARENCEINLLPGGATCATVNDDFISGTLRCFTNCTYDFRACVVRPAGPPDIPNIFRCVDIDRLEDRHQCIAYSPHNPVLPLCLESCGLECTNCEDHSWPWWVWLIAFFTVVLLALIALALELCLNRYKPPVWGPVPTYDERMEARRLAGLPNQPGPGMFPGSIPSSPSGSTLPPSYERY